MTPTQGASYLSKRDKTIQQKENTSPVNEMLLSTSKGEVIGFFSFYSFFLAWRVSFLCYLCESL